ncbi:MAG TPA: class II aldolase [Aurantimonas coralicida]|uniref:Class II aldolase n=2 Tax=root TaxID=1 RepID=A0A9C9NFY7_9HYPH|nr:class II aldolase [Aurantimonas coralicida]HEU01310.1 class II aldolase [Aurantimonas coralicida]
MRTKGSEKALIDRTNQQPGTAIGDGLGALRRLSRAIGRDRTLTQAAGGNTSLKRDGILWVKASGTWLADAETRDIFVPVRIAPLLDALRAGDARAEKATDFVASELSASKLRPSIETAVHAAMPQPVVLHAHCVNTIAHAVTQDAEARIAERLTEAGFDGRFADIPYCRPGVPLARQVARIASDRIAILILGNHGLIVAGTNVADAAERLDSVVAALAIPPRPAAKSFDTETLANLAADTPYRLPSDHSVHHLARDPDSLRVALAGPLYPDHVIFLGETIGTVTRDAGAIPEFLASREAGPHPAPSLLLVRGVGVLVHERLTAGGEALVGCLADVAARIPSDVALHPLSERDVHHLTHWEAETYRQALDRPGAPTPDAA